MKNAPMLDAFLQEEINHGTREVCIDLSACSGMDSTFMGVLVGFSQVLTHFGGRLVVINPTDHNLKLLNMLGVCDVLPVVARTGSADLEFVTIPSSPSISPTQRLEIIRRAHQHLVSLNQGNEAKFSAFLRALEADLLKIRGKLP
jgi:anti-anti-sigma factor